MLATLHAARDAPLLHGWSSVAWGLGLVLVGALMFRFREPLRRMRERGALFPAALKNDSYRTLVDIGFPAFIAGVGALMVATGAWNLLNL